MLELIQHHAVVILAALLAVSEALALIPSVKSNSVFTLIVNGVKKIASLIKPAA